MRVALSETDVIEEELSQMAQANPTMMHPFSTFLRPKVLGLVFLGLVASAWVLQGQRTGVSGGDLGGTVGLAGQGQSAQKAGVLSVCEATMQVLSTGGHYSQKYDISSGVGTRSFPCPYGSTNRDGEVSFDCSESGMWKLGRHNCYHCEGKELTLNRGAGRAREVDLPFGSQGDVKTEPCEFQEEGGQMKKYTHGDIMFTCGASRDWELARMTCSDRKCADAKVVLRTQDGKDYALNLEVKRSNEDQAEATCPNDPGMKMEFECVAQEATSATKKQYSWRVTDTPCEDLTYPENDDWCAARTARVHAKRNWDGTFDNEMTVRLSAAFKGVHEYPCPPGWPNQAKADGTGGKMEFECAHGTWAMKYMDCTGDEVVGQKSA